jgi:hypothetical protein
MLPDQSAWIQYPMVAVIVLAGAAIAYGFYRLFRDLLAFVKDQNQERSEWITEQNKARETEREKQRAWETEENRVRDERWQAFLKSMQESWLAQDGKNNDTLKDLTLKIDLLIAEIKSHHATINTKLAIMDERTKQE